MEKNPQDWESRFQELEREVYVNSENATNPPVEPPKLASQFSNWYSSLPNIGKAVVVIGGIITAFSILNTVLKLVASLISVVILIAIVYGGYKFLIGRNQQQ